MIITCGVCKHTRCSEDPDYDYISVRDPKDSDKAIFVCDACDQKEGIVWCDGCSRRFLRSDVSVIELADGGAEYACFQCADADQSVMR